MKNHKYLFLLLLLPVFLAILFFIPSRDTHADFGDFSSGSDYGGGSSSSHSSSSSSYSSHDYSSSSSRSSRSSSSGSSSGSSDAFPILSFFFYIPLAYFFGYYFGKQKGVSQTKLTASTLTPTLKPMSEYKSVDPDFDESVFKEKVSNLYVQFQNAWQAKNLETLRPYLTDIAFAQYDRQLNRYRNAGTTNKIEKIAVLSVDLKGWSQDNGKDQIVARIKTRIVDYVVNDKTGKIVEGSDQVDKFMEYEWSLIRTTGIATVTKDGTTHQRCPNCSGANNINETTKCSYCRHIVSTDKFNWLVSTIKGISQRTGKK